MRRAGGNPETRERVGGQSHEASNFRHSNQGCACGGGGGSSRLADVASVRPGPGAESTAQGTRSKDAAEGWRGAATAAGRATQAEFLALDESVSEGPGGKREGGLPDWSRRRSRDGTARGGGGADRAGRRAAQDAARHAAARHGAAARHARRNRRRSADDGTLRD